MNLFLKLLLVLIPHLLHFSSGYGFEEKNYTKTNPRCKIEPEVELWSERYFVVQFDPLDLQLMAPDELKSRTPAGQDQTRVQNEFRSTSDRSVHSRSERVLPRSISPAPSYNSSNSGAPNDRVNEMQEKSKDSVHPPTSSSSSTTMTLSGLQLPYSSGSSEMHSRAPNGKISGMPEISDDPVRPPLPSSSPRTMTLLGLQLTYPSDSSELLSGASYERVSDMQEVTNVYVQPTTSSSSSTTLTSPGLQLPGSGRSSELLSGTPNDRVSKMQRISDDSVQSIRGSSSCTIMISPDLQFPDSGGSSELFSGAPNDRVSELQALSEDSVHPPTSSFSLTTMTLSGFQFPYPEGSSELLSGASNDKISERPEISPLSSSSARTMASSRLQLTYSSDSSELLPGSLNDRVSEMQETSYGYDQPPPLNTSSTTQASPDSQLPDSRGSSELLSGHEIEKGAMDLMEKLEGHTGLLTKPKQDYTKEENELRMEQVKYTCLSHILQTSSHKKEETVKYLQKLNTEISELKELFYTGKLKDKITFLKTLFLDGCYIFWLLNLGFNPTQDLTYPQDLNNPEVQITIAHDLLLRSNQIPFIVVELIHFVYMKRENKVTSAEESRQLTASSIRKYMWQFINENALGDFDPKNKIRQLLHLAYSLLKPSVPSNENGYYEQRFRRAIHYYDDGISFKVRKLDSVSCSILDVSFSFGGVLNIPKIIVNEKFLSMLGNLVKFEHTGNYGNYVTEYVRFLTLVVRGLEDVELLLREEIISSEEPNEVVLIKIANLRKCLQDEEKIWPLSGKSYLEPIYQSLQKNCHNVLLKWFRLSCWRKVKFLVGELGCLIPVVTITWAALSYFKKE